MDEKAEAKTSPVIGALDGAMWALRELEDLLDALGSRLNPVRSASVPSDKVPELREEGARSTVRAGIEGLTATTRELQAHVKRILSELEL